MDERKPYKTDLTEPEWAVIKPLIAAWKAKHPSVSGHQGRYEMREIVNALRYQNRTGCQWELLPHDLPPTGAVRYYFDVWKHDGLDQRINDVLRMMVREKAGRAADPSLVVLDSQSVRAAAGVPKSTTGMDAAKKTPGRRRGLAVDVIGLIIAVVVIAASVHDNAIGTALLNKVAATTGTVYTALVDQGFKNSVVDHGRTLGVDVQIVARNPARTGFVPEPIRWRVEQTNGLNMLERRLARDYEHSPRPARSRGSTGLLPDGCCAGWLARPPDGGMRDAPRRHPAAPRRNRATRAPTDRADRRTHSPAARGASRM